MIRVQKSDCILGTFIALVVAFVCRERDPHHLLKGEKEGREGNTDDEMS
jgi:hypothetical protein